MALREPAPEPGTSWRSIAVVALAAAGVAVGAWTCSRSSSTPREQPTAAASASTSAPPDANEQARPLPRCTDASPDAFVIGEAPAPRPASSVSQRPDSPIPEPEEPDDLLAPFAVEVGRGAVFDRGFAAGTLRAAEGGTIAMIATVDFDGKEGKLVRLARSRGDLEPPVVTGVGASLIAAMLEPNAAGRAIKIAKVTGEEVTWGVELSEGRDESLALDVAASGARAIIVWDDVLRDAKRSSVLLASFDTGSLRSVTRPRPASPPTTDADSPRVIARPGGYWLAYAARRGEDTGAEESRRRKGQRSKQDEDTAAAGETISNRWVEVIPLDEAGAASANPRAVTPKDGHVLAFDIELGEDGAVLVAFRDDDTPSGSSGGRVSSILVRPGGGESTLHVLAEEDVGTGIPELLPGWIAIASISGPTRLATMTPRGELIGALAPEPSLGGGGEPIAATRDALLIARPTGKAMKLSVMRCAASAPASPSTDVAPAKQGDAP